MFLLRKKNVPIIISFFLVCYFLALFFSFYKIDADPSPFKPLNDLMDEGAWAHAARSKILFGKFLQRQDDITFSIFGAPLYTLSLYVFFKLAGVSQISNRCFSVLCLFFLGIILSFFVYHSTRSIFKSIFVLTMIQINHELITYSRFGTPILMEVLFFSVAFCILIEVKPISFEVKTKSGRFVLDQFFFSGIFCGLALLSKGTQFFLTPGMFILVFLKAYFFRKFWSSVGRFFLGYGLVLLPYFFYLGTHFGLFLNYFLTFVFYSADPVFIFKHTHADFIAPILNHGFLSSSSIPLIVGALIVGSTRVSFFRPSKNFANFSCFFIILFSCLFLSFFVDRHIERRFVIFMIPLTFLFAQFVFYCFDQNRTRFIFLFRILGCFLTIWFIFINFYLNWNWASQFSFNWANYAKEVYSYTVKDQVAVGIDGWLFSLENELEMVFASRSNEFKNFNSNLVGDLSRSSKTVFLFERLPYGFKISDTEVFDEGPTCFVSLEPTRCDFPNHQLAWTRVYQFFPKFYDDNIRYQVRVSKLVSRKPLLKN